MRIVQTSVCISIFESINGILSVNPSKDARLDSVQHIARPRLLLRRRSVTLTSNVLGRPLRHVKSWLRQTGKHLPSHCRASVCIAVLVDFPRSSIS